MAVNQLKDVLTTKNFKTYTQNYLSVPTNELITTYKIPQDRVDIIPEALKLYEIIIDELAADTIEYSFWSISDGLAKKIITDQ
jgi:exopolyphosphatase/pppGpp-phosphohydrolase